MTTCTARPLRAALPALALLAGAAAQDPPAVIDDAFLRGVVAQVLPEVERACGRTFARPPQVALADVGDVMRSLREDLAPMVETFFAGQPRARIQKQLQLRADLLAGVLGKYGFGSGEIYVLPHMVKTNLGFVGHQDAPVADVLRLVVAHELVHALQDQELDLKRAFLALTDSDRSEALAMAIEGHAVFCSERAAEALGLRAAIDPLRAVFVGDKDIAATPTADLATRRIRGQGLLIYLRSAEFFAREFAAGGHDRLWQILREEAPRTRRLLLPAGQDAGEATANLAPAFAGIDERFAGRNWTVGRGGLSDRLLLGENLPRGADLLALLPKLQASGEWFAMSPTPAAWRALYALSFADAGAAIAFCALAEDVAADDLQDSKLVFTAEPGPGWEGVVARRVGQAPKGAVPLAARAQIVWWRSDRHVVQATLVNAPLDDEVLAAVARQVLERLAQ